MPWDFTCHREMRWKARCDTFLVFFGRRKTNSECLSGHTSKPVTLHLINAAGGGNRLKCFALFHHRITIHQCPRTSTLTSFNLHSNLTSSAPYQNVSDTSTPAFVFFFLLPKETQTTQTQSLCHKNHCTWVPPPRLLSVNCCVKNKEGMTMFANSHGSSELVSVLRDVSTHSVCVTPMSLY